MDISIARKKKDLWVTKKPWQSPIPPRWEPSIQAPNEMVSLTVLADRSAEVYPSLAATPLQSTLLYWVTGQQGFYSNNVINTAQECPSHPCSQGTVTSHTPGEAPFTNTRCNLNCVVLMHILHWTKSSVRTAGCVVHFPSSEHST